MKIINNNLFNINNYMEFKQEQENINNKINK